MKLGTTETFKFGELQRQLGLSRRITKSILAELWDFAKKNAIDGNVGKFSDEQICRGIDYVYAPEDPGTPVSEVELIRILVELKWLDRKVNGKRLVIHDWYDHTEDWIHKELARRIELFADGRVPKLTKFMKSNRDEIIQRYKDKFGPDVFTQPCIGRDCEGIDPERNEEMLDTASQIVQFPSEAHKSASERQEAPASAQMRQRAPESASGRTNAPTGAKKRHTNSIQVKSIQSKSIQGKAGQVRSAPPRAEDVRDPPADQPKNEIDFQIRDGTFVLTSEHINDFVEAFPNLDILANLRIARLKLKQVPQSELPTESKILTWLRRWFNLAVTGGDAITKPPPEESMASYTPEMSDFAFITADNTWYRLTNQQVEAYQKEFSELDIETGLENVQEILIDNPDQRRPEEEMQEYLLAAMRAAAQRESRVEA